MKTTLLNHVATDDPERMLHSNKGWEVPVEKLKQKAGGDWQLLTPRCARENVRKMMSEWHKVNIAANQKK
jgi:hypothetical protein